MFDREAVLISSFVLILLAAPRIDATCDYEPIGVVDRSIIKNSQMTSSSYHSVGVISYNGRLNAWSAWCAKTNAGNDWLQIDMGTVKYVCGVGLQGKEEGTDEWTKTYKVGLSVDGTTWTPYKENGQEKIFQGNTEAFNEVRSFFSTGLKARYLRLYPLTYHVYRCLRTEIYVEKGCANEDLGIMADPLARWNITTPATLSYRQKNGSSSATPVRTWCTSGHGGDMWLQVDLAYMQYLCAVEVRLQAANNSTANYTVSRSLDGLSWEMFAGNKIPKEFLASLSFTVPNRRPLGTQWPARHVRFHLPVDLNNTCLTVELYGQKVPPPKIRTPLEKQVVAVGGLLKLDCTAEGFPPPYYTWNTPKGVLGPSKNLSVLIIQYARFEDIGLYNCTATNEAGQASSAAVMRIVACDYEPVGVADRNIIKDSQMSSSSYYSWVYIYWKGRLNGKFGWCPRTTTGSNDWLEVDMGRERDVCGFGTQAKEYGTDEWTETYKAQLSVDRVTWLPYMENGQEKIFPGNSEAFKEVKSFLETKQKARYVRLYPLTYHLWRCLRMEIYVEKECPNMALRIAENPLNLWKVKTSPALYSSQADVSSFPVSSRVWCTTKQGGDKWLQVDLVYMQYLCAVEVRLQTNSSTVNYTISRSFNGSTWEMFKTDKNTDKEFPANLNLTLHSSQTLSSRWPARNVRFHLPENLKDSCLTVELYGIKVPPPRIYRPLSDQRVHAGGSLTLNCSADGYPSPYYTWTTPDGSQTVPSKNSSVFVIPNVNMDDSGLYNCTISNEIGEVSYSAVLAVLGACNYEPLGVEFRNQVKDNQMNASSFYSSGTEAWKGRLNGNTAWCAKNNAAYDWLQIDMGTLKLVCGVGVQGKESGTDEWTETFKVHLSVDGVTWTTYNEKGQQKIFLGNHEASQEVRRFFIRKQKARYVRIYPLNYHAWRCMRTEIYTEKVVPLQIQAPFRDQVVQKGDKVILNCTATGYPPSDYSWITSNVLGSLSVSKKSVLVLRNVTMEQAGLYKCTAANELDQVSNSAFVTVVDYKYHAVGVADRRKVPDESMSSFDVLSHFATFLPNAPPTQNPLRFSASHGRLNDSLASCGSSSLQWLKIDLGERFNVCGIATQGLSPPYYVTNLHDMWTKTYNISTSLDGVNWNAYEFNGEAKIFHGNFDGSTTVLNLLERKTLAKYVKINVDEMHNKSCLRVEVFAEGTLPRLTQRLTDQEVERFSSITLVCASTGFPNPVYSWTRNGEAVNTSSSARNQSTIVISRATQSDSGEYLCTAVNEFGKASSRAKITVYAYPRILKSFNSKVVILTDDLTLTCVGDSLPYPDVTWLCKGSPLTPGHNRSLTVHTNQTTNGTRTSLVFTKLSYMDSGEYACVFSNYKGEVRGKANLEVHGPPAFTVVPESVAVTANASASFHCQASSVPPPTIRWLFNGEPLKRGQLLNNGSSLYLDDVTAEYDGEYTCEATNYLKTLVTSASLTVYAAPRITEYSKYHMDIPKGQSVVLYCNVTGKPAPLITWTKDEGTDIPHARYQGSNNRILIIDGAQPEDSGTYTCIASNTVGEATVTMRVGVFGNPIINRNLTQSVVMTERGSPANLACYATNPLPINYTWTKDGNYVTNGVYVTLHHSLLTVTPLEKEDFGIYVCHVSNIAGYANYSISLTPPKGKTAGTVAGLGHQARSAGQIAEHVIIGFLVVALAISVSFIVYRLYRKRVEKYPVDKPVIEMNAVENELYMKYS